MDYKKNPTFPVFIPVQKFLVKKTNKSYEQNCRNVLLSDKPGCYLNNVGTGFNSFEEELRDFVLNSEHCPPLIKLEFEESQLETQNEDSNSDVPQDQPLLISPLQNPGHDEDIVPTPLQIHMLPSDIERAIEIDDEDISNYDVDEFNIANLGYDWSSDKNTLIGLMDESKLNDAKDWLKRQKQEYVSKEPDIEEGVDFNTCNAGQKKFYHFICDWIQMRIDNAAHEPIYSILSGRAGCGKTYVVKCIQKFIKEKKCKEGFLKLAAPTGAAAFLIKGSTLHSLLDLPIKIPFDKVIPALPETKLMRLQEVFRNTEILIIDEMSMVGQYMLYQIHKRLQDAKPHKSTEPFGGVSIVLMGDFAQLPPVTDTPLFVEKGKGKKTSKQQLMGRFLYTNYFDKCFTLNEIMRQRGEDQATFRDILDRVANGNFTQKEYKTLKEKCLSMDSDEAIDKFKDAVKLCAYNNHAVSYNIQKIKDLKKPIALIAATNTQGAKKFSASRAGGLHNKTIFCKDAKVMLLSNLWSEQGLTNGSNGFVRYIVYDENSKPPELPKFVLVYFPLYTGPDFLTVAGEKLVPIVPIMRSWFIKNTEHQRTMIPLIPSYAISIHKSQGQTMDKIILDLGDGEFAPGLTYTALSRAKKLENIAFDPFPSMLRIANIRKYQARLDEEQRLINKEAQRIRKF